MVRFSACNMCVCYCDAVSRESNPWEELHITEMIPPKADTLQSADHKSPSIDMQGDLVLILNPNQNPMQRAKWETRTPIAPMARSTLAVIAALELTPLPQTIRELSFDHEVSL